MEKLRISPLEYDIIRNKLYDLNIPAISEDLFEELDDFFKKSTTWKSYSKVGNNHLRLTQALWEKIERLYDKRREIDSWLNQQEVGGFIYEILKESIVSNEEFKDWFNQLKSIEEWMKEKEDEKLASEVISYGKAIAIKDRIGEP